MSLFHGKRGAVSLTYDDGNDRHLDAAVPDLETHHLHGTFFVPTRASAAWQYRPEEWREVCQRGHEIANHTQFHPCGAAPGRDWIKKGHTLEEYDRPRIAAELLEACADLAAVLGPPRHPYTFAYTCCEDWVGPRHTSFRDIAARVFPACRGGARRELADPAALDFGFIPSWMIDSQTGADSVLDFIDSAIAQNGWAVLVFHAIVDEVANPALDVPRKLHQQLCRHIADRQAELWCGTFHDIAMDIRGGTGRPWVERR